MAATYQIVNKSAASISLHAARLDDGQDIPYRLVRSVRRNRSVAVTMTAHGMLQVTAPLRAPPEFIEEFLYSRSGWIRRVMARYHAAGIPALLREGAALPYLGHACRLDIVENARLGAGCRLLPNRFVVTLAGEDFSETERHQAIKLELLLWLKRRARRKLPQRLALWSRRLGIAYESCVVSNPRRRWGSCSGDNVIRLNWRLIMAPLRVLDYVCVHELCHVRHKNHSSRFWQEVAQAMPDYQMQENRLKPLTAALTLL